MQNVASKPIVIWIWNSLSKSDNFGLSISLWTFYKLLLELIENAISLLIKFTAINIIIHKSLTSVKTKNVQNRKVKILS